jgi:hypothetical protein
VYAERLASLPNSQVRIPTAVLFAKHAPKNFQVPLGCPKLLFFLAHAGQLFFTPQLIMFPPAFIRA